MFTYPHFRITYDRAQVLLNKTARWVTGLRRRTKVADLMKETGWMTIKEMHTVQSCILLWKTIHLERPGHLHARLPVDEEWNLEIRNTRLQFTECGWRWKTSLVWNMLPEWMRAETKISCFKKNMKSWILEKRTQEPDWWPDPETRHLTTWWPKPNDLTLQLWQPLVPMPIKYDTIKF